VWQEKAFPHFKLLWVRVYMRYGLAESGRESKGSFQKEHDKELQP
jgi:hypothetical protein